MHEFIFYNELKIRILCIAVKNNMHKIEKEKKYAYINRSGQR